MNNHILLLIAILFISLIALIPLSNKSVKYVKVKIGNFTLNAKLADNQIKKIIGLMGTNSLQEDEGMLFIFNKEGYHSFWTFNMKMPIDIIFLDKNKKVVDIKTNAKPCKIFCEIYRPKKPAIYVLETKANFTKRHGIKIGSLVHFDI